LQQHQSNMVQSLGISVGNANSYVAAGQGGGIEILLNEFSNRSTPSMVAFTEYTRSIGVEANSNFFMNLKNTVYDLMVLLGKPYKDVKTDQYPFMIEEAPDGGILVVVRHLGEERKFNMTQVLAMLFTKLRGIAKDSVDCVLSCPQFYSDHQKSALIQAALIAGLNPLQVITDMSAVVLNYAYYRTTKNDAHKIIAFVNFGQSNLQCVVAWLTPKEDVVRILASESEPIGGVDFDRVLADYFVRAHNLSLNQKSYLKLVSACEKLKRNLSANSNEIPISVESLISEDKDFNARIERATFEELSSGLFQKVENCFRRTLEQARVNFDKTIAAMREEARAAREARAAKAAKAAKAAEAAKAAKESSKEDEAARAQAASANAADGDKTADTPMETDATDSSGAPEGAGRTESPEGADVKVENESPKRNGGSDANGSVNASPEPSEPDVVFELHAVEMVGGSTRIPAVKRIIQNVFNMAPSTTLNTDEAVARGCVLHCATLHPGTKVKRNIRVLGAESYSNRTNCDKNHRRVELELITHDRKHLSRTEARNNLEEYIYSERSALPDGDEYKNGLSNALDWLFSDEGEEATEEAYNSKLAELRLLKEAKLASERKVETTETAENKS
jgi:hypothetical protein